MISARSTPVARARAADRRRRSGATPPCRCRAAGISSPRRRSAAFVPPGGRLLIPMTGGYGDRMIRLAREAGRDPGAAADRPRPKRSDPDAVAAALAARSRRSPMSAWSTVGNRQRRRARCPSDRRGGARGRTAHDRRRGLGVRRPAAGHQRACRRSTRRCSPPTNAWRRCPASPSRSRGSTGWKHAPATPEAGRSILSDIHAQCAAQRRRQLPLHAAGADPQRARRGAGLSTTPRADSRPGWHATPPICARCTTACSALGLTPYLRPEHQGRSSSTSMRRPIRPGICRRFVDALKRRGVLISNFYNTPTPSFRVGCIGAITPADMAGAVDGDGRRR